MRRRIDRESILNVQFNQDQSFPVRGIMGKRWSDSFFFLTFHLARKGMIVSLSSRTNRDHSRFVLILISFTAKRPKREVALRRVAEINWCRAITLHPLICFGLLQCDRRLAFSAQRCEIRRVQEERRKRSNNHFHYRLLGLVNVLRDATKLTLNV